MNARISRRQCEINRRGMPPGPSQAAKAPCLSCDGCSGLGDVVVVKSLADPPPPREMLLVITGENLTVMESFGRLSKESGGVLVDDLCTIFVLYLAGKLMCRVGQSIVC